MKKVLVASNACGTGISKEELREIFIQANLNPVFQSLKDSLDELDQYDGILIGTELVTDEVLDKAKNVKVVMKYGVGTDNIDKDACAKRNTIVESMPGINSSAVAEMAFALLMASTRKVVEANQIVKEGKWQRGISLSAIGKTLGIIGTGSIGRELANLVSGLKMNVIGYDVFENDEFKKLGTYVSLEQLCKEADYVSVHVPLNDSTYHLISDKEFALMKKTCIVINTARGGIVDEDALYKALKEEKIMGACLDVYEGEKPSNKDLIELPNIITTPHVAAYERDTLRKMDKTAVDKLSSVLNR